MHNGCILCGGVGKGKSRTALAYYYRLQGGDLDSDEFVEMVNPKDLYIITTAKKRDSGDWNEEGSLFLINTDPELSYYKDHKMVVDSWNRIEKYKDVKGAFFIFDEQRVVGKGPWVKAFLRIAKSNDWILLSATPGDTWEDYLPVFMANGYFRTRQEFYDEHCIFNHYVKWREISGYRGEGRLIWYRRQLLVDIDLIKPTVAHHYDIWVDYDVSRYKQCIRTRTDPRDGSPIENASQFCQSLQWLVNTDISRVEVLKGLIRDHARTIVFYNFNYELHLLRKVCQEMDICYAEWNGHVHQVLPKTEKWVYLVQYTAGCEGWNCIDTDTVIFYSQNYSYRKVEQASGRIDRVNTPFKDLYYYHLKSRSSIDLAIARAYANKEEFNKRAFSKDYFA